MHGACQSYFEAIISAGANFASSPARILIDFLDPLVIAEKIAFTEKYKYITIDDIAKELRDGKKRSKWNRSKWKNGIRGRSLKSLCLGFRDTLYTEKCFAIFCE